jgi:hypothetical protein
VVDEHTTKLVKTKTCSIFKLILHENFLGNKKQILTGGGLVTVGWGRRWGKDEGG